MVISKSTKKWIALIRAIGPATHKKMSMQDLRESCVQAGLENVSTYIASGNLLFASPVSKSRLTALLQEILAGYDLENDIILRTPAELKAVVSAAPFPGAAKARPNHLLVVFLNNKLNKHATDKLAARDGPESILALDREFCVDYKEGVGRSKLTPALIERHLGQPGTARNWNTVNKLIELSG
jgi:uncharacterized protein (DUF1697 family)